MAVRTSSLSMVTLMLLSKPMSRTRNRNLVMCFLFDRGANSLKSFKQDTVTDSTTESEYIAASEAAKEAAWIRRFISWTGSCPEHPRYN